MSQETSPGGAAQSRIGSSSLSAPAPRTSSEDGPSEPTGPSGPLAAKLRVVRDADAETEAVRRYELIEQVEDLPGRLRVQIAGRLVGQDERGIGHQRARDGHALPLAPRQLVGAVSQPIPQPQLGEHRRRHLAPFPSADAAAVAQRQRGVFDDVHARQQVEVLEDEPDLAVADARQLAPALRCSRASAQAMNGAARVRKNSEWLTPRWKVKSRTGSPCGTSTSRSGSEAQTAPHSAARGPAFRPSTAVPRAAPTTICVNESMRRRILPFATAEMIISPDTALPRGGDNQRRGAASPGKDVKMSFFGKIPEKLGLGGAKAAPVPAAQAPTPRADPGRTAAPRTGRAAR